MTHYFTWIPNSKTQVKKKIPFSVCGAGLLWVSEAMQLAKRVWKKKNSNLKLSTIKPWKNKRASCDTMLITKDQKTCSEWATHYAGRDILQTIRVQGETSAFSAHQSTSRSRSYCRHCVPRGDMVTRSPCYPSESYSCCILTTPVPQESKPTGVGPSSLSRSFCGRGRRGFRDRDNIPRNVKFLMKPSDSFRNNPSVFPCDADKCTQILLCFKFVYLCLFLFYQYLYRQRQLLSTVNKWEAFTSTSIQNK